jgi:leucyl aminopeptidase
MVKVNGSIAGLSLSFTSDRSKASVTTWPQDNAVSGIAVGLDGPVPAEVGLDRAVLQAIGFEGKVGQAMLLPKNGGLPVVAVGIGDASALTPDLLRNAAAAFARAAGKYPVLCTNLADAGGLDPELAAQAVVEGALLARYRYGELKHEHTGEALQEIVLVTSAPHREPLISGAERGRIFADAAMLARDLANMPPAYLTATRMAEIAGIVAGQTGLAIEVSDKEALINMGCGGLLGVNAGSTEPPRMIKLTYRPRNGTSNGHLAMVGKGVMYDSGGISLKPSDSVHATMKQDMSGAAAILGAMSALSALECGSTVTGYLMCTDNMPSGSATKLGDVLTIRGGKTVEVLNTDAEGRLILADGLVLSTEDGVDAIVDIATLTGACLRALGPSTAGLFGNNQAMMGQVSAAASRTDEPVWELPLDHRYRRELDSDIADIKNMGGPNGAAIHAALFLEEFIGDRPWAHLDIAGPVLIEADEAWRPKGASGFGTRLLLDLALNFAPPPR